MAKKNARCGFHLLKAHIAPIKARVLSSNKMTASIKPKAGCPFGGASSVDSTDKMVMLELATSIDPAMIGRTVLFFGTELFGAYNIEGAAPVVPFI